MFFICSIKIELVPLESMEGRQALVLANIHFRTFKTWIGPIDTAAGYCNVRPVVKLEPLYAVYEE